MKMRAMLCNAGEERNAEGAALKAGGGVTP